MSSSRALRSMRRTVAAGAALALAACAFEAPTSHVPATFDFGPPPAYQRINPGVPGTVLVAPVRAPAWLDDGIAYRLLYEDAARPLTYAQNRWAADPSDLIADRLRSRLAAVAQGVVTPAFGARSDYTLRVELEDFSQHFEAAGQGHAVVRARASLLQSERRTLVAQRTFDVQRPTQPNAPGAVKGLTEATDALLEELVAWTAENTKGASR